MLKHTGLLLHLVESKPKIYRALLQDVSSKKFMRTLPLDGETRASLRVVNNVGVVTLHSPGKVNLIDQSLVREFERILPEIERNSHIKGGLLISNKPECFIAGAQIDAISLIKTADEGRQLSEYLQNTLKKISTSKKPFVAAIMGVCLGGGLETALACHYRLAVRKKSTFSLPEVKLGILPGAGGTQMLPRITPLPDALDMMLTGKMVSSEAAKSLGLVDQLIESLGPGTKDANQSTLDYLEEIGIKLCLDIARGDRKLKRNSGVISGLLRWAMGTKYGRDYIFNQARTKVLTQTRGFYPAPLKILEVTKKGLENKTRGAYEAEAAGFGELSASKEAKGLTSLFHGISECKNRNLGKGERKINTIAVLGAGLMGAGICNVSIRKGYRTIMKDVNLASLAKGEETIQNSINSYVKKHRLNQVEGERWLANLVQTTSYEKFSSADIVIEAVFEDIELKRRVLQEVEKVIPEHCIYATNTSALIINQIADASKRPDKVIGMHYFSPVDKMQLIEIVTTETTSPETMKTALGLGLKQGKVPILVKDSPGFFTTRVVMAMVLEGYHLLLEGMEPMLMDQLTLDLGFPMGIMVLSDEIGIDVGYHVYKYFSDVFGARMEVRNLDHLGQKMIDAGFIGKKNNKGIFLYQNGTKNKKINPKILELVETHKISPKVPMTPENVQQRVMARFLNEAALSLQEGVISNPVEADIGAVFGLGFPPFTGGPFHYIDYYGADKLVNTMKQFEAGYGAYFSPCQLLIDHAKDSSKKFFPQR